MALGFSLFSIRCLLNFNIFSIKYKAYPCAGVFLLTKPADIPLDCYEGLYLKNTKIHTYLFLH